MSDAFPGPSVGNPFATRHVRPGALPFRFPAAESCGELLERLRSFAWRGAIVGPHGSGKSTLLATLIPALTDAGRDVLAHTLTSDQHDLPPAWTSGPTWTAQTQLVLDGYEQLSLAGRWWLWGAVQWRGCGLLVTSHVPVWLPTLLATQTTPELAWELAQHLAQHLGARGGVPPTRDEVESLFHRHAGNLRTVWFALYDLCEQRRREKA